MTMNAKIVLVAAFALAAGPPALALDGYDSDNNPIPGTSRVYRDALSPDTRAQFGRDAPRTAPRRILKPGGKTERRFFEKAQGLPE
jgi:hypothetical protein